MCLFDQWYNGTSKNINKFTNALFEAFLLADGNNRAIIAAGWPEWFEGQQSL